MPIAEDSAGGSPVPVPTDLTTNLTGEATGSGTLDYTTGDIDIVVTVVDNGHNHILDNITDVQVNNAISGQVLKYNGNVWVNGTDENAGITAIVQDTSPQLGGNLDLNNRNITGTGNLDYTGNITLTGTVDGRNVSADGTKLDGIESGATADQTAAQIKTAYESNSNTNAFTDADHTKLDGIETAADVTDTTNVVASLTAGTNVTIAADGTISATGGTSGIAHVVDDTSPELGGNLSLNSHDITGTGNLNFTGSVTLSGTVDGRDVAADGTKLDGIEAGADVTDTANVTAAGALMDSEVTNLAQVKAFDSSDYATAAQGTTADAALPKAGGTMTGNLRFNDGIKAQFGNSNDLQIWHNGTDSYVYDTGEGDLILRGSSNIKLQSSSGTALSTFTAAGASTLYYSAAEKLATTSSGIDVTGNVNATASLTFGSGGAYEAGSIYSDANWGMIHRAYTASPVQADHLFVNSAGTERMRVTSAGIDVTGVTDSSSGFMFGTQSQYLYAGSNDTSTFRIGPTTAYKYLNFTALGSSGARISNASGNLNLGSGANNHVTINTAGNVGIGTTSPSVKLQTTVANSSTEAIRITNDTDSVRTHMYPGEIQAHNSNLTLNANDGGFATVIKAAGTERMRIDSGGIDVTGNVVGDGLTIAGDSTFTGGGTGSIVINDEDSSLCPTMTFTRNGGGTTTNDFIKFENSGGEVATINSTGGAFLSKVSVNTSGASNSSNAIAIATSGTNFESDGGIISIDHAASGAVTGGYFSKYSAGGTLRHSIKGDGKGYFAGGIDVTGTVVADKMFVEGTANTRQWEAGSAGQKLAIYAYDNSTFYHRLETGNATNYQWGTYDNIPIYTITNNSVKTTLLGNGNFGVGTTAPKARTQITSGGYATPSLGSVPANASLYVSPSDTAYGLVVGMDNVTPRTWLQSQHTNGASVAYALTLQEAGGNVGVGLSAPTAKMHLFTDGIDQSVFSAQTDLGANNRILTLKSPVSDSGSAPYRWQTSNSIQWEIDTSETKSMILNSGGYLGIGTYNPSHKLTVNGDIRTTSGNLYLTGNAEISNALYVGGANATNSGYIESPVVGSSRALQTVGSVNTTQTHVGFENLSGEIGRIDVSAFSVAYVTSSDYRLKTDIQPMQGSIDRVKALNPVNFEWTGDGSRVDGFIAHEAQEVVPEAISGEKDAMRDQQYVESEATGDIYTPAVEATYETIQVELTSAVEATYDEDGNELTPAVDATYEEQQQELTPAVDEIIHSSDVVEPDELEEGQLWRETTEKVMATRQVPDYQGIDQSKIVPLLTSALQDAIAKIEALETRLTALES
jgi:hypothetical protein